MPKTAVVETLTVNDSRPHHSLGVRIGFNSGAQIGGSVVSSLIPFFTLAVVTQALGHGAFSDLTASTAFVLIPVALGDIGLTTPGPRYTGGERLGAAYAAAVVVKPGFGRQLVTGLTAALSPMRTATWL